MKILPATSENWIPQQSVALYGPSIFGSTDVTHVEFLNAFPYVQNVSKGGTMKVYNFIFLIILAQLSKVWQERKRVLGFGAMMQTAYIFKVIPHKKGGHRGGK